MSNQKNNSNNSGGKRRSGRGDQAANRNNGGGNAKSANAKGGNNKNANSGGRQNEKAKSTNSRRRKGSRKKKVDPRVFWGNAELLEEYDPPGATITTKPAAAVLSLGRPPLSGQQNAAEHYFSAVYGRAVNLAAALAAAGELLEPDELTTDT